MSYAMPQQSKPTSGKPWTLIIGGVIALVALLLCCGGGFLTLGPAQDLTGEPMQTGAYSVTLDEGEKTGIWSTNEFASCTVTGPSGTLSDESPNSSSSVTWGDKELERVMAIKAEQAGSHTITCSDAFVVGEGPPALGIAGLGFGGMLCCISVVVLIIGLVLWLMKRKG